MSDSTIASEYREDMDHDVLHVWAKDAKRELNLLQSSASNYEQVSAVLSMRAAIAFSLEDEDGLGFLRCWNEGDFDAIREEWPDAPKEVFLADPLLSIENS